MAMFKMRAGQAKSFNNWLRMRVVFQGLTIAAVCWGTYNIGNKNAADRTVDTEVEEQKRREEKVLRERAAFEERLKAAEEMHNEMVGTSARATLVNKLSDTNSAPPAAPEKTSPPSQEGTAPPPAKSSWKSWLGL
jgi:hypothetical protein